MENLISITRIWVIMKTKNEKKCVLFFQKIYNIFQEKKTMKRKATKQKKSNTCSYTNCNKTFKTRYHLVVHIRTHTGEKPYICIVCKKAFAFSGNLAVHKRIHTGEKKYVCDFGNCKKAFTQSGALVVHKRTHSGEKPFVCDFGECVKAFAGQGNLVKHKRFHTGERPYVCEFETCTQAFTQSGHLTVHERTHTGERPYVCNIDDCEQAFMRPDHLINHIRTHTLEKPFSCDFENCNKSFSQTCGLARHKMTHTGEKPHECDFTECESAFATYAQLITHKRTHTGERPYQCEFEGCDKSFAVSFNLLVHKRGHTGERPYLCNIGECDKEFITGSALTQHKRTHSEEKPFECEHCLYKTKDPSSLRKHHQMHERQKNFKFECKMQDGGTQLCSEGDIQCSIRTETERDMEYHIERNHTLDGIGKKLQSETKLAKFFDSNNVAYDRDWANVIQFKSCNNIEGNFSFARPDFYLAEESARLNAIVIVGNDEFGHRMYPCDFKRLWNICQSLEQDERTRGVPILYVRFNPHHYYRDGVYYSHPLETGHKLILSTLQSITVVKQGVNLVYIHYDKTDGTLDVFKNDENDFAKIYQDCVLLDV
jgi:uncharacterized Zn-finger protein